MVKPLLIFGYGNLSRGDDALGPLLLAHIERHCALEDIELLVDFQLQIEHALDLEHRTLVLFVDASVACTHAYSFTQLSPAKDTSYTSHAMSPAAVLAVHQSISKHPSPPCFLLSLRAEKFTLGDGLSLAAKTSLAMAGQFVEGLLVEVGVDPWLAKVDVTQ
jgi:hydrogenase maturation protease